VEHLANGSQPIRIVSLTLLNITVPRMKRIALLVFLLSAPAAAQPGGVEPRQRSHAEGVFSNQNVFQFGSVTASGTYSKMPSQTGFVYFTEGSITPVFNAGQGATKGGFLAYHRLTYLGFALPQQWKVGVDFAIAAAYVGIDWSEIYDDPKVSGSGDGLVDATIGPMLSFNPIGKLVFDATARIGYGAAGGSMVSVSDYPLENGTSATVDDTNTEPGAGTSTAFGLRVRYGAFMVGWEAHSNTAARIRSYSASTTGAQGRNAEFEYTIASKMPTSRFSVGFTF
jgi:hypothetical protein